MPEFLARFARTHASWSAADTTIEDHLVSLADKIWKAARVPDLEDLIFARIASARGTPRWQAFTELDDILQQLADGADRRLAYQAWHPVDSRGAH